MIEVIDRIVTIPNYTSFSLDYAGQKFNDSNYSEWIMQLSEKVWVTLPMLEQLAEILKKEAPQIDWNGSLQEAARNLKI